MPRKRQSANVGKSAAAAYKAGADVATTLAFRLPILFSMPTMASAIEWQRAVGEKMVAAALGAAGAGAATHRLALKAASGRVDADDLANEWLAIADAALEPGYRAVASNARRLSRGR